MEAFTTMWSELLCNKITLTDNNGKLIFLEPCLESMAQGERRNSLALQSILPSQLNSSNPYSLLPLGWLPASQAIEITKGDVEELSLKACFGSVGA